MDPVQTYEANVAAYSLQVSNLVKKVRRISLSRLIVFVVSLVLIYWFASNNQVIEMIFSLITGLTFFLFLIKYHSKIISKRNMAEALLELNNNELKGLKDGFSHFPAGEKYIDHSHRYASDLDVFGEGSLFQFINRTATLPGNSALARQLCNPILSKEKILLRQEAVNELKSMLPFRQKLQAIGMVYSEKEDDDRKIRNWINEKPLFQLFYYKIAAILIPLFSVVMIVLLSTNFVTEKMFVLYLAIPWGIAGFSAIKTNRRHQLVSNTTELLQKYSHLLSEIENKSFQSELLRQLQGKLTKEGFQAGNSIKKLKAILTALDNRLNFVSWAILNGLFLWDILQMIRLENWQKKYQGELNQWFDVLNEIDILNSLANFAFNHPEAIFPEVTEETLKIEATELGHPLIPANVRVNNDFEISKGEFTIITGANMAGKSTYLRTIGTNLILAMCGAPVIARRFLFKPADLYTSIRTTDSLFKNESYFYAELKRLSRIIDELRKGREMFIILDEILKGTNSKDKHKGSEALLRQFINFNATGIVATHDVSLSILEEKFPNEIKNRCFEVDISGNELSFDYKLRKGVSQNMNATLLMKKMGITI